MIAVGELVTPTGVLVMTAERMHTDRAGWLAARRRRDGVGYCVGASDIPSILDLDSVDTPVHVYRSKVHGIDRPPTEQMEWGSIFEEPIAAEWTRRNRAVIDEIGLVAHAGKPWLQATVDRRVRECPAVRGLRDGCGLEVKHVDYVSASRWHAGIPDRILAQVAGQVFVTGWDHMHWVAKVPGGMKQGILWAEREADLIRYIVGEVETFRDEHLVPGVEPAWNTVDKAAKLIELDSLSHPERVGEIDLDGVTDVMEYAEAQAAEAAARKRKEQAKARLAQLAGGHEIVTFSGERAYWYGRSVRTNVDLDVLAERYPSAYADPDVVSETISHPIYVDKAYKERQS